MPTYPRCCFEVRKADLGGGGQWLAGLVQSQLPRSELADHTPRGEMHAAGGRPWREKLILMENLGQQAASRGTASGAAGPHLSRHRLQHPTKLDRFPPSWYGGTVPRATRVGGSRDAATLASVRALSKKAMGAKLRCARGTYSRGVAKIFRRSRRCSVAEKIEHRMRGACTPVPFANECQHLDS